MRSELAIEGGTPVRQTPLPYGRHNINEADHHAVSAVLSSEWLTTGPAVQEFEAKFALYTGAAQAVAVCNGTAALHAAMYAIAVGVGDEVLVPALTFAATANCAVYQGATPIFVDVQPDTLLIDPEDAARKISSRTRALIAVDYAGQPCDYHALRKLTERSGIALIADACHSMGASYNGTAVGTLADLTVFSLHPVKAITAGEGGIVTTDRLEDAFKMRCFRNHGVTTTAIEREQLGAWAYDMASLGYNYRLSDIQCALGMSQLSRLEASLERRRSIAAQYDEAFASFDALIPVRHRSDRSHAYHLYVVRLNIDRLTVGRDQIFKALRAEGIGVNVHYLPVHFHSFYRIRYGTGPGLCPNAEKAHEQILSLPIFPTMTERDVNDVIEAIYKVITAYAKKQHATVAIGSRRC